MVRSLRRLALSAPVIFVALIWAVSAGRPDPADSRIHVFNSTEDVIEFAINSRTLEGEYERRKNVTLQPGQGFSFHARHVDQYDLVIKTGDVEGRRIDVPSLYDAEKDYLVDLGGEGEFVLIPHFYLTERLTQAQRDAMGARLRTKFIPIPITDNTEFLALPRKVRIGFQSVAAESESRSGSSTKPLLYWELKSTVGALREFSSR